MMAALLLRFVFPLLAAAVRRAFRPRLLSTLSLASHHPLQPPHQPTDAPNTPDTAHPPPQMRPAARINPNIIHRARPAARNVVSRGPRHNLDIIHAHPRFARSQRRRRRRQSWARACRRKRCLRLLGLGVGVQEEVRVLGFAVAPEGEYPADGRGGHHR